MSLTAQSPQPTLAWQFESSNVDSVTGLAPSAQVSPGPAQLQGSAALVTNAPTSNTAVSFPGTTGSYMSLGTSTPTNINQLTSNIFVEAWVYFNDLSIENRVFNRATNTGTSTSVDIVFRTAGSGTGFPTYMMFNYGSGGFAGAATAPGLTTGTWIHVAMSSVVGGTSYVFVNGTPGTGFSPSAGTYNASYTTFIGVGGGIYANMYIRDLRVVQGGVVPTTSFTPETAPFSYSLPSYVSGSGSAVFTLMGQFVTYVPGKYRSAINFYNTLSPSGQTPNSYAVYDVSSFSLSSNSTTVSFWLNSGLTYPVTSGTNPFYINLQGSSYNGLYTLSASSNISFRTGTVPVVTVGNVAAQSSVWNHYCAVFSNVGASSSNTTTSYYFNGSLIGTANNAIQNFTTLNLGCQTSSTNGASCSIDDIRLFNTALTASQVQAIYAASGMPMAGGFTITSIGYGIFSKTFA